MRQNMEDRMKFEIRTMERHYPQFVLARGDGTADFIPKGRLYFLGELTTRSGNTFTAVIVYPENFPYDFAFKSYILELYGRPFNELPRHIYRDYSICMWHEGYGDSISRESTAASVVGWISAWLHGYEYFMHTGFWPGEEGLA